MLTKENFSGKHIQELREASRRDPGLLERTVYAFGLLEALTRVKMPFVFKGGTSLMLLLDHPMRLSTDIDIIVEPGVNVDSFLQQAAQIFPFQSCEEQKRIGKNNIVKRHFKFSYCSPLTQKPIYILLDILYEDHKYSRLTEKEIRNELLLTEGSCPIVLVPSVNSILGDKLTAYAPHTTGVPLGTGKDMEIIKQMYDVATLIDVFDDFGEVYETYKRVSEDEIAYRGLDITPEDALRDTLCASASIATRGKMFPEDYTSYLKGIRDIQGHVYGENFTAETAQLKAPKIMYLVASLIKQVPFEKITDGERYIKESFTNPGLQTLKSLKKRDAVGYGYAIKTDKLIGEGF